MIYDVAYSLGAERDLAAIWRYGEDEWGRFKASDYVAGLRAACDSLSEMPQRSKTAQDDVRGLIYREHIILYRIVGKAVEIGFIAHQRSNFGAMLSLMEV